MFDPRVRLAQWSDTRVAYLGESAVRVVMFEVEIVLPVSDKRSVPTIAASMVPALKDDPDV